MGCALSYHLVEPYIEYFGDVVLFSTPLNNLSRFSLSEILGYSGCLPYVVSAYINSINVPSSPFLPLLPVILTGDDQYVFSPV